MRPTKLSQLPLIVGITLGLIALYGGGAPILGAGNSLIGGFYVDWASGGGGWIGCSYMQPDCANCAATVSSYCSMAYSADGRTWYDCDGGTLATVSASFDSQDPIPTAGALAGCSKLGVPMCSSIRHAVCD